MEFAYDQMLTLLELEFYVPDYDDEEQLFVDDDEEEVIENFIQAVKYDWSVSQGDLLRYHGRINK